jgi:hypothetical protein
MSKEGNHNDLIP